MKRTVFSKRDAQVGQSLVEFALTVPLLILLMLGVVDLGFGIYAKNTIADAAREGCRYGIVLKKADGSLKTDADIRARVRQVSQGLDLSNDAQIVITPSPTRSHFNPIVVTVNYTYTPLSSFIVGGVSVPLSSSASMMVE